MISFPNAKINIGLNVIRKRSDGFHELESIFYPVKICDGLEVIESDELKFSTSGITIDGNSENNLCLKAYKLVAAEYDIPPVHIHLHKKIPIGAGLGGGSSDASFLIRLLNDKFSLGMDGVRMRSLASRLGSDCAFFVENVPAFAEGRGEVLNPIQLDLSSYYLVIVMPPLYVSTADAFDRIVPVDRKESLKQLIQNPVSAWKELIVNDFEKSVFRKFPQVEAIKVGLYAAGAIYASMSGSGASVYGLFEEKVVLDELALNNQVFYDCGLPI